MTSSTQLFEAQRRGNEVLDGAKHRVHSYGYVVSVVTFSLTRCISSLQDARGVSVRNQGTQQLSSFHKILVGVQAARYGGESLAILSIDFERRLRVWGLKCISMEELAS